MKIVIFIITFFIKKCFSINGIIWNKENETFVPIYSIKRFKLLEDEILEESLKFEKHNFLGEQLRITFYNEEDIFEFYDNDQKVTGICGDVWTILSEYLNFTMVLTKTDVRTIGTQAKPNDNFTGLLGMIQRKEYEIIPKIEAYPKRLEIVDFSFSIWKDQYRTFIQPYYQFKITWMLDLFSWQLWCLIVIFYVLLSTFSILSHNIAKEKTHYLIKSNLDYFFYTFGALCNQGDVLYEVQTKFKIQSFCISLFSWFLITSFSSQLIIYMTQTILIPPFKDLESLLENTDYNLLGEKYSVVHIGFTKNYRPIYTRIKEAGRIRFYPYHKQLWDMACTSKDNYAVLQSEYVRMDGFTKCALDPIGEELFKTWIVSGIAKDFAYKKSIDLGILRLRESGIMTLLKSRWMEDKSSRHKITRYYTPITLDQIALLLGVYVFGLCGSIIILFIENSVYYYQNVISKRS